MYSPCDTNNPSNVNPTLRADLTSLQGVGDSHYSDALFKTIEFFQEAPMARLNTMFFMSDGKPTVPGKTEAQQTNKFYKNSAPVSDYAAELAVLDNFEVHRVCVGPGSTSDTSDGMDLDIIDNTDSGPSERGITHVLISNPVVGKITNFEVIVNEKKAPDFSATNLVDGPTGYTMTEIEVDGLDPYYGAVNKIELVVTLDSDGDPLTTDDQQILRSEVFVPGALQ